MDSCKYIVVDYEDVLRTYINAKTPDEAMDIVERLYPDDYKYFDLYKVEPIHLSGERFRLIIDVVSKTEKR